MLDPKVAKEPAGVLALANTLAVERYNGTPLRDLAPAYQRDLVLDAKGQSSSEAYPHVQTRRVRPV